MFRLLNYDIMIVRHSKINEFVNGVAVISDTYKKLEAENQKLEQKLENLKEDIVVSKLEGILEDI